jgi:NAD+ kinase
MHRVGVVLHPTRPVRRALDVLEDWTAAHGLELVRTQAGDGAPRGFPSDELAACDVIAAVGGDGTVLTALHAAARSHTPVVGVACGSLGALTKVSEAELRTGLDQFAAGEWWPQRLPALVAEAAEPQQWSAQAINDFVLVRRAGTQLLVDVSVGGELYARLAGDGVVVATPLGSSAYSMAAGGPVLSGGTDAFLCTPLAMHGGCAPPVVVPADREVVLDVDPGWGGFDIELDGHRMETSARRFALTMERDYATLVGLGEPDSGLRGLRARGLIADSPRVLARDARARAAEEPPR